MSQSLPGASSSELGDDAPPTVSVIVPLFNGLRFIEETIRSVLGQSHRPLEVIVVDDGSSDGGVAAVRRMLDDPRVALITKAHLGIAATRNVGLSWSDPASEFVLFLDQDDVIAPDLLAGLARILASRPDAVGAYAIADFIDDAGTAFRIGGFASAMRDRRALRGRKLVAHPPTADVDWPELFLSNHIFPPSAVLLRKRAVIALDGFDPSYDVADDWDLLIRMLRHGPIVPWDVVRVGYRRHSANASSNLPRNIRETRAVWANTYYSAANGGSDRTLLRRYWRAHQRASARRKAGQAIERLRRWDLSAAAVLAADAAGHVMLLRPLARWRTTRDSVTDRGRIGAHERRGRPVGSVD